MNQDRAPLIVTGQIYLNEALNEYIIVTKNNRGQISYAGNGFMGRQIDEDFIDGIEYRPGRLEITDGNLWLGFTVCKPNAKFKDPSLQCRMAIINSRRLPGKASKAVIKTQ